MSINELSDDKIKIFSLDLSNDKRISDSFDLFS